MTNAEDLVTIYKCPFDSYGQRDGNIVEMSVPKAEAEWIKQNRRLAWQKYGGHLFFDYVAAFYAAND